ncbi:hypothetical protein LCGC14_1388820 [marine sediment metagenome]|uniref:Uncharacterized protein n=1 Tax=marine sediment metagenome TaxID=412755 RepID=A0A0F9N238_9ZZZZ
MITSVWGIEGSGKSSVGLSYPKPLFHLDLDLGGFDRAVWRLEDTDPNLRVKRCEPKEDISKLDWNEWDIVSKPYLAPIQLDKLLGVQQQAGVSVRFPRQVEGIKELWQEIITDVVTVGRAPAPKTIMPDSATQHWWICHTGFLQEKQEIQIGQGVKVTDDKFREKLLPIEFPNNRMRDFIYTVRSFGKHLVMTHYPKDIYANRVTDHGIESYATGEVAPDGFKHTMTLVDIVLWCYTEIDKQKEIMVLVGDDAKMAPNPDYNKPVPRAKVSLKCGLAGMGMKAVGLELPTPSYEGLMKLQSMMRGSD